MSNRRKIRPSAVNRSRATHGHVAGSGGDAFSEFRPVSADDLVGGFATAARKTCSECGAPVKWVDEAAAGEHGLDVGQARAFLGAGAGDDLEYWVCTNCENSGVFGPSQFSL